MLEKDTTEVTDQKNSFNDCEECVFHYENGVSCTEENPTVRDTIETFFSKKTAKTIILFILSALLLCGSFLPLVTVDEIEVDSDEYSFSLSCLECIDLSVKYFYSLNDEELMETELAKEVLSESEEISGDLLKKQVYLTAMSEDVPVNVTVLLLGVVSLLYMGVCALVFFLFLIKLIVTFVPKLQKISILSRRLDGADSLFCLLICVMPAMLFVALQSCRVIQNDVFALLGISADEGVAWGAVLAIIFALTGVLVICLEKLIRVTKLSEWKFNQNMIGHLICGVLALTLVLSAFFSCFTVSVSDDDGELETEVAYGYLNLTEISESRVDYYQNLSQSEAYTELLDFIQDNDSQTVNSNEGAGHIMGLLSIGYSGFPVNLLYILLTILLLTILLLSGVFLWTILQSALGKVKNSRRINTIRVALLICIGVYVLLLMLFNAWISLSLSGKTLNMLCISLGVAPILMLVSIVGTMFFSFGNVRKTAKSSASNRK